MYERPKVSYRGETNYKELWKELRKQIKQRILTAESDYETFTDMNKEEHTIRAIIAKRHLENILLDMEILENRK